MILELNLWGLSARGCINLHFLLYILHRETIWGLEATLGIQIFSLNVQVTCTYVNKEILKMK